MLIRQLDQRMVAISNPLHRWLEGKGEVDTLLMPGQGLAQQILLPQMHLTDRHQTLQRRDHRPALEPVGTAQHPFQPQ